MRALAIGVVVSALLVSGCSSGREAGEAVDQGPTPAPQAALKVSAKEFEFDQPVWAVPARRSFSVRFTNRGTIPHEWAVLKRGITLHEQRSLREEMVLFEVEALPEGETHTQRFTLREPGRYQVVCALEGHFDAGMTASLAVVRS